MRDLDITYRDLYGRISFGFKKTGETSGIETLIQKFTVALLSSSLKTYFHEFFGGEVLSAGKFNFGESGSDDFKMVIASNITAIISQIKQGEIDQNIPFEDRIKSAYIKDIVFDKKTTYVSITIQLSTNSQTKLLVLPVK